jgi:hypothetical protein
MAIPGLFTPIGIFMEDSTDLNDGYYAGLLVKARHLSPRKLKTQEENRELELDMAMNSDR